jgi:hypothetical protein
MPDDLEASTLPAPRADRKLVAPSGPKRWTEPEGAGEL